ncbi:MAG: hypothetical protein IPL59_24780 [Candidatus Competibacteraceae bacterium]|nr:hypothetical protein [Candidatus Competibacteraceae bacterium]
MQPTRFYFEKASRVAAAARRLPVRAASPRSRVQVCRISPVWGSWSYRRVAFSASRRNLPQFGRRLAALLVVFLVARLDPRACSSAAMAFRPCRAGGLSGAAERFTRRPVPGAVAVSRRVGRRLSARGRSPALSPPPVPLRREPPPLKSVRDHRLKHRQAVLAALTASRWACTSDDDPNEIQRLMFVPRPRQRDAIMHKTAAVRILLACMAPAHAVEDLPLLGQWIRSLPG